MTTTSNSANPRRDEGAPITYPWSAPPAEGEVTQVAPGVLWIRLPLPMALDHVNVYAFDDGDSWTLVDTGFASKRSRAIWQKVLDGPLAGKPVGRVLVTHHHPDHIGLAGWFQTHHGASLCTTRTAWLFARMLLLDEQEVPAEETLSFWRSAGMAPDVLAQREKERPFNFADCVAPLPLGFSRVCEGGSIRMGGRDWDVRLGNGHAPDHITLWSRDDALVVSGDQLLPSISPNIGVYATEPEADPLSGWMESCARFAIHARDDHLVLPGHKLPFKGLPARLRQLAENHVSALARLRAWLKEDPRTAHECFSPLFRREISLGEYGLALVEAIAHLNHLHQSGEAKRVRRKDGAWLYSLTSG